MPRPAGGDLHSTELYSFAGLMLALLALALGTIVRAIGPAPDSPPVCDPVPPLAISLPDALPSPSAPTAQPQTAPTAASPSASPRASPTAPSPILTRQLFRGDDLPSDHGLAIASGPLMPVAVPLPCVVSGEVRRIRPLPCVGLLPPGGRLCASGAVGEGRLSTEGSSSSFALQVDRVTLRDVDGGTLLEELQGYARYDDPERGLLLMCPRIAYLETISSNALRFAALCSNRGADGWAISGQVTDGGIAAPDSASLTVDAPDGSQLTLVGSVARGAIIVRTAE